MLDIKILNEIIFYVAIYLHGLVFAWIAIHDQEISEKEYNNK